MDCLRSYSFGVDLITNVSGATDLKQWSTGAAQHFWQISTGTSSTYNIEGYKNINVYGIDLFGTVQTQTNILTGGAIVNDWAIDVKINGQGPRIGGFITGSPNFYAIDGEASYNLIFPLGKYTNSLRFGDAIESVKSIQLQKTYAQGNAWETLGNINLRYRLNFVVLYKFEGE